MKKLTLALAATAIAAAASSTLVSHGAKPAAGAATASTSACTSSQLQQSAYRDEESLRTSAAGSAKVVVKQVVKYVEKPAPAVAVAKYIDGQGRQFDLDQQGVVRRQEPVLVGRQGVRLQERLVVLRRRALDRVERRLGRVVRRGCRSR